MLWAVIIAGGRGTRFWPESRNRRPKQFLKIFGKKTLLEQTVARLSPVIPRSRILIITNKEHVSLVRRHSRLPASQIIGEPVGRNTAPCAVLAAELLRRRDPKAVLAILPADHHIENEAKFRKALEIAAETAVLKKMPVTFGLVPAFAHTGYGYLEAKKLEGHKNGFRIVRLHRFHEKPDRKKAEFYVRAKRFFWNSGMFIWSADDLLKAAKKYLPKAYQIASVIARSEATKRSHAKGRQSGIASSRQGGSRNDMTRNLNRFYRAMPNISIDYGLMEKLKDKILCIPLDIGWSDVGGWESLGQLWPSDASGNAMFGNNVLCIDSSENIIKSQGRLIAMIGMKGHVVVDAGDAVLIAPRRETESIRKIVKLLEQKKLSRYL